MADSLTLETDDFITMLKATKITALTKKIEEDPGCGCAHLMTADQPGSEPGKNTVLVATSTDRNVAGQFTADVDGSLRRPILFPMDVQWLIAAVKQARDAMKKIAGKGAEFTVRITVLSETSMKVETLTDGMHQERDTRHEFALTPVDKFPYGTAVAKLIGRANAKVLDVEGNEIPAGGKLQAFDSTQLAVMSAAEAVFGQVLHYTPKHHASDRFLTNPSGTWRAVVPGSAVLATTPNDTPETEVVDLRVDLDLPVSDDPEVIAAADNARMDSGDKKRATEAAERELAASAGVA